MKIVYAEDDKDFFDLIQMSLHELGVYITWASNATEALEAIHAGKCEALICDYYLPDMPGLVLAKTAAELGVHAAVISGSEFPRKEVQAAGMDFIRKGRDVGEVATLVKAFLVKRLQQMARECDE